MAASWRQVLRRYVDAHFRSHAADKIFDVIAHNYDRWDEKSVAFLTANESKAVKGQEVSKGHDDSDDDDVSETRRSREITDEFLEDCQIAAPTIRLAKYHATCSQVQRQRRRRSSNTHLDQVTTGNTYLYYFNDTGVTHDLLTYVFGAPLSPGIDPFHPGAYSDTDRQMAVDVIKRWANFIYSGYDLGSLLLY